MTRAAMSSQPSADEIIVVSGLPRSGTSLMMQMLDAAGVPILQDGIRKADACNPRGYFELEAVKASQRDNSWVARAPGHAVKVIHSLLPCLPRERRYRVILMQRPIDQVIRSQNRMLETSRQREGALPAQRLATILSEEVARARKLLDAEDCFDWLPIDYPQLVSDPVAGVRQVIDFLGLRDPEGRLSSVVEPALFRNQG